ncbi:MAG TPA: adenine nucleotide alpha hydrolase [Casimicrobiaceae bacterium]|nr:adenine nucleotide alpha hydrolase [Casimicrobiaceae bacterium]
MSTIAALVGALDRHPRLAIAVSGGVDSMTLAHVAARRSRTQSTMYHASSPAVPASARERVEAHAAAHGWPLVIVDAAELADPRYRANPVDRCYFCKTNLYDRIGAATADTIASGTNVDDLFDFRPGLRAASERGVVHPYVEAGIDKAGVYAIAASLGLADLERLPAQPCLSSRVETGIAIDAADLAFIDAVESLLAHSMGRDATLRCRLTHAGVVIELAAANDPACEAAARDIAREACRAAGRAFAGVRPYARGAAFLHRNG